MGNFLNVTWYARRICYLREIDSPSGTLLVNPCDGFASVYMQGLMLTVDASKYWLFISPLLGFLSSSNFVDKDPLKQWFLNIFAFRRMELTCVIRRLTSLN